MPAPSSPSSAAPPGPGGLPTVDDDTPAGAVETPLSQAERAARALADGKREVEPFEIQLLTDALDYRATLRTVAAAFVPRFADWAFIHLVDEAGIPRRVKVAHADPARADLAAKFRSVAPGPGWATLTAQSIRDGAPRLVRDVSEEMLRWAAHDERHLAALQALAPHSMLVLPLQARDRVIGGVTLMRATQPARFTEDDLVAAQRLTIPAALALDNARATAAERFARDRAAEAADVERHARVEVERALTNLRRLQGLAVSLSAPLLPEAVGRLVFDNGLSGLGAKTGTLALARGEDELTIAYACGWPKELLEQWRTFRADARSLVAEAFRTRAPLWIESFEALSQVYPSVVELPRARGEQAWAAVPLLVDGRAVGALGLGFAQPRRLDDAERELVLALAAMAGQAVSRAAARGRG
jgi:GAF domain-containing protein